LKIVNFGNAHSKYFSKLDGRNDVSGKHPYVVMLKWVLDQSMWDFCFTELH